MSDLTEQTEDASPINLMDAKRYEILRHAEDLFGHYGFAKTNMADIAARAKMSSGNLYRYYRNKQAIGIAVIDTFFRQSEAGMDAAMIGIEDPEVRIRAMMTTGVRIVVGEMARNPKIMELVEFLLQEEEAWAHLQGHIGWKRDHAMAEIERGIESGQFAKTDVRATAVNLMHATKAFQMPQSLTAWREPETILPELDGVLDLVFSGLRS